MRLSASNLAWGSLDFDDLLATLSRHGLQGVEIAPTALWPDAPAVSRQQVATARSAIDRHGLRVSGLQSLLYGQPDLQLLDERTWPRLLEHLQRVLDLAGALGAACAVFGSPRNRVRGALPVPQADEVAARFFSRLEPALRDNGVVLTLEPNAPAYGADYLTHYADVVRLARPHRLAVGAAADRHRLPGDGRRRRGGCCGQPAPRPRPCERTAAGAPSGRAGPRAACRQASRAELRRLGGAGDAARRRRPATRRNRRHGLAARNLRSAAMTSTQPITGVPGVPDYLVQQFRERQHDLALVIPVINEDGRITRQLRADPGPGPARRRDHRRWRQRRRLHRTQLLAGLGVRALLTKTGPGQAVGATAHGLPLRARRGLHRCHHDGRQRQGRSARHRHDRRALRAGDDFVQGSRFVPGGRAENTPWERYLAIRLVHAPITSLGARHWFTDTTNGFRGHSRRLLTDPRVAPFRDVFETYELLAYLPIRAARLGVPRYGGAGGPVLPDRRGETDEDQRNPCPLPPTADRDGCCARPVQPIERLTRLNDWLAAVPATGRRTPAA